MLYITERNYNGRIPTYKRIHVNYGCWRLWADYKAYSIPKEIAGDATLENRFLLWLQGNQNFLEEWSDETASEELSITLRTYISPEFITTKKNTGSIPIADEVLSEFIERGFSFCQECVPNPEILENILNKNPLGS